MNNQASVALLCPELRYRYVQIRNRGYLPHWEQDGATYFVTFRLHDALPAWVSEKSVRERERLLDEGQGHCWIQQPKVADAVRDSITYLDGKRYRLVAWCAMPNHVHLIFKLLPGQQLSRVMHSLKSFSAHQANRLLGLAGPFWQREYYDHLIRKGELDRAIAYVLRNPVVAGLGDWRWVGRAADLCK